MGTKRSLYCFGQFHIHAYTFFHAGAVTVMDTGFDCASKHVLHATTLNNNTIFLMRKLFFVFMAFGSNYILWM